MSPSLDSGPIDMVMASPEDPSEATVPTTTPSTGVPDFVKKLYRQVYPFLILILHRCLKHFILSLSFLGNKRSQLKEWRKGKGRGLSDIQEKETQSDIRNKRWASLCNCTWTPSLKCN